MKKDTLIKWSMAVMCVPIIAVSLSLGCFLDDESDDPVTDTVAPTVVSTVPANKATVVLVTSNIQITFSEAMDTNYVTANTTSDTGDCSGTIQVFRVADNKCVKFSGNPQADAEKKVFTLDPASDFLPNNVYRIRVTIGAKDAAGNSLATQYDQVDGFTTEN